MPKKNKDQASAAELEKLLADTKIAAKDRIRLRDTVFAYFVAGRKNGASVETIRNSVTEILKLTEAGGPDRDDGYHELAQDLIQWSVKREGRSAKRGKS